jgi:hypothetical protein
LTYACKPWLSQRLDSEAQPPPTRLSLLALRNSERLIIGLSGKAARFGVGSRLLYSGTARIDDV